MHPLDPIGTRVTGIYFASKQGKAKHTIHTQMHWTAKHWNQNNISGVRINSFRFARNLSTFLRIKEGQGFTVILFFDAYAECNIREPFLSCKTIRSQTFNAG